MSKVIYKSENSLLKLHVSEICVMQKTRVSEENLVLGTFIIWHSFLVWSLPKFNQTTFQLFCFKYNVLYSKTMIIKKQKQFPWSLSIFVHYISNYTLTATLSKELIFNLKKKHFLIKENKQEKWIRHPLTHLDLAGWQLVNPWTEKACIPSMDDHFQRLLCLFILASTNWQQC